MGKFWKPNCVILNTLALTHPSRTSWGYGDFVNAASSYKLALLSSAWEFCVDTIGSLHETYPVIHSICYERRFRFLRDDSMLSLQVNNILRSRFSPTN
jgi:hypothetical protein